MFSKFFQRLRHQACAVLFGIVLISACTVSAGAVFTEGSGDGMVLYGNHIYPDFSDYLSSSFKYAIIGDFDGTTGAIVSSSSFYVSDSDLYVRSGSSFQLYYLVDGSWVLTYSSTTPDDLLFFSDILNVPIIWSNYDVFDSSGSLVLSSATSMDLTGYNFIQWDGDTTGLDSLSYSPLGNLFYYGSVPFDITSFSNSYELIFYPDGRSYLRFVSPVDYRTEGFYFSDSFYSAFVPSVSTRSLISSSGLYLHRFYNSGWKQYCKYFIYPVSSDSSIDFSQTFLTASNPQYDYQSAEFDVSWSNLPEIPYPDNVQYFIQGRLNDGSAAQPPEIYLGSSSDPPTSDVPVSFSFSGLQPETQYTATFELVYNTTGSFRDFIGSGVTSTVSFTTLSDGSISEGDKAIINAIQNANKDNQAWTDSQFGSAVGDLPEDTSETDNLISGLDQQEEAYKDDAYDRFQELSSAFSGFDGTVGSGIGLAGTLFSRFFNALGSYKIVYTFPLLLGLAMVLIGRLGRSSIRMEREPDDHS